MIQPPPFLLTVSYPVSPLSLDLSYMNPLFLKAFIVMQFYALNMGSHKILSMTCQSRHYHDLYLIGVETKAHTGHG